MEPIIVLENIRKTYRMGTEEVHAVDGVSLEIEKGDFVALRGPSGSGKSTVMNIIGCLDSHYSGRYILEGCDVSRMHENQLAKIRNQTVSFVHQNFNLLPRLSALENVELPLIYAGVPHRKRVERSKKCLGMVGLEDRKAHNPRQLSGGQCQRVAIARAMLNQAPLLLADEPTGNLDTKSSVEIMTILQGLNERGTTILLVTHEQDIADWARRSIFFRDGKLGI